MAVKTNAKVAVKSAPPKTVATKHSCAKCETTIMSNDVASWLHIWYEGTASKRSVMRQYHKKCAPSISADSGRSR
jgi:hypothetical protein